MRGVAWGSPAKKGRLWKKAALFLLLPALLWGAGCSSVPRGVNTTFSAMDTVMTVTVYGGDAAVLDRAEALVRELEGKLSVTDPDSQIAALNREGRARLSADTADLLGRALELCRRTGGALDLTVYPLVRAWGFTTGEYTVPGEAAIEALLPLVDYTRVELEGDTVSLPAGMALDLGAVAKGYTGDALCALLRQAGVEHALLELGGNIQALGTKPGGAGWRVAIRDPDGEGFVGVATISGGAVITSGGYERYFERDGVRYWHIIDPATGAPARSGLSSVTVVGESGLTCDALSTALFVMGKDRALDFWRESGDFEAVLVEEDGSVTVTAGLEGSFTPADGRKFDIARR